MDRPTCATCAYYQPTNEKQGECHHDQAKLFPVADYRLWGWPQVLPSDFCGQHNDFRDWMESARSVTSMTPLTGIRPPKTQSEAQHGT